MLGLSSSTHTTIGPDMAKALALVALREASSSSVQLYLDDNIVAYLRHARTVTSEHAPAITQ
jgi:hypothetical protein